MSELFVEAIDPERIHVGDGVHMPSRWDAVSTGEPDNLGAIRVGVVYDQQLRRSVAASVRVDRLGEGEEVTAALLRDVSVLQIVQRSALRVVTVQRDEGEPAFLTKYLADVHAHASDREYGETVLEAVRLYRIATTVNIAPLKLVSDQLGVSVSTATRMMARAREAGLAEDLITRETYNRMRADEEQQTRPHQLPGSPSGPSLGR
ncbi:hypothetical protein [Microbacterium sp. E-13]|uniref:hypothetical protein n=1 Tax=Microbacterium sp. E-13 TaxID=3404048 RepID=UPI003CFA0E2F